MAFHSILHRASSSVLPLAIRSVRSSRTFHGAVSTLLTIDNKGSLCRDLTRRSWVPFQRFSTDVAANKRSADENLIRVLESEIPLVDDSVQEIPDGFPFEIQDNTGERTIFLTREFDDEIIKVEVDMPNISAEDEGDEDAENDEDVSDQSSIPLVVSVSKGSGLHLEFGVTAYPDEITIDSLSIKQPEGSEEQLAYEGPEFSDLDENLQKAFLKYLEVRGINPSTTNFLHEYMIKKDNKEYLEWLKNLKNFIEH
ncbi:uncharacterized protein At2g39795, mitochondrial [Ziziphus jujuba]|uniref:Uncharacterized protein At2g39795, mitochondrial n=1 Tax=Ziziphus jujuba TaxID=326968 RepID=A0A6P4B519_ZIZJJ|nr:uncharacterized protein At2g39795, mitochondrial [Ziziphus jujuba]